jgi:hypothetical protein
MRRRVIEWPAGGEIDKEFLEAVQRRMGENDTLEKIVIYGRDDRGWPYKFVMKV